MDKELYDKFAGHKANIEAHYYCVRGNVIDCTDIETIVPEYHNNYRSLYLKVIKKSGGKNIIKMTNREEYNYIIRAINVMCNMRLNEI